MDELNRLYVKILHVGFLVIRQAIETGDQDWARAEIILHHNVPSLINEANIKRHEHYWDGERTHYLEWLSDRGSDHAKSLMQAYYEPIWREMKEVLAKEFRISANE